MSTLRMIRTKVEREDLSEHVMWPTPITSLRFPAFAVSLFSHHHLSPILTSFALSWSGCVRQSLVTINTWLERGGQIQEFQPAMQMPRCSQLTFAPDR